MKYTDYHKLLKDLLDKIPSEDRNSLVLVGGQALSLWAAILMPGSLTSKQAETVTSTDIDFIGFRPVVDRCAGKWGAVVKYPTMEDSTMATGIVTVPGAVNGNDLTIDFMSVAYGIDKKDIESYLDTVKLGDTTLKILSPPLVLKARLANYSDLRYNEFKKTRERGRIEIAAQVVNRYIKNTLDQNDLGAAKNITKYVRDICLSHHGVAIASEGIDLSKVLVPDHKNLSRDYSEKFIPNFKSQLKKRIEKGRNMKHEN